MNNIDDIGFIIYVKKYKENSLLIKILSENNNIIFGYVNKGFNKYNYYKNQIGNLVNYNVIVKNDNMNIIDTEVIFSNVELFFYDKINIVIFNNCISLINYFVKENENSIDIYKVFKNIIFAIKNNHQNILLYYIDFLMILLKHLGININLEHCAITGQTTNLYYLSPKTGSCVIKEEGDKYKNKLFVIPQCFQNNIYEKNDLINAFNILYYFITKFTSENNLFYIVDGISSIKTQLFEYINKYIL